MLTRDDWSRLSGRLPLDVTALELLPDLEARLLDVRRRAAERGTDLSLAERWSQVTREALSSEADEVVCLATPDSFFAVGEHYEDFAQTTDEEVVGLLQRASAR